MKHTIYSNYNLDEMYADARQYLIDECECAEPSDDAVWDEIMNEDALNWDCEKYELNKFFKDKYCIFVGTVGRWDGTYEGGKIGKFWDLFYSALTDCHYFELYDEDGHLFLHGSHHDGDVSFEIKILTDKGYNFSENWSYSYDKKYDYSLQEMHNKIMNCSFLSRLPHFSKTVYGC